MIIDGLQAVEGIRPRAWTPELERRAALTGYEVITLHHSVEIPSAILGSCPGDCYATGKAFVFEFRCPRMFIYHEIAHWYDVKSRGLDKRLSQKNYGFDAIDILSSASQDKGTPSHVWSQMESRASRWTVALMVLDGLSVDEVVEAATTLNLVRAGIDIYAGYRNEKGKVIRIPKAYREWVRDIKSRKRLRGLL
jgi:hypothetical protein